MKISIRAKTFMNGATEWVSAIILMHGLLRGTLNMSKNEYSEFINLMMKGFGRENIIQEGYIVN